MTVQRRKFLFPGAGRRAHRLSAVKQCRATLLLPTLVSSSMFALEVVKPHGRLVQVSFTHCGASTPCLLPRGLQGAFRDLAVRDTLS